MCGSGQTHGMTEGRGVRGGSWSTFVTTRAARIVSGRPCYFYDNIGFRVVPWLYFWFLIAGCWTLRVFFWGVWGAPTRLLAPEGPCCVEGSQRRHLEANENVQTPVSADHDFRQPVAGVQAGSARQTQQGDVSAFEYDLEGNLLDLQAELQAQTYRPGLITTSTSTIPSRA